MIAQLLRILRESIKAVPAMKYALAVAGLLAVVALVGAFKVSPQAAVLGAVITLVLMVVMVIFARLTTTAPRHFFLPVQFMMWAFLLVTVATAFLLFTSAFFQWPRGLGEMLDGQSPERTARRSETVDVRPLVSAAQQQRSGRDYAGAWATIGRAVAGSDSAAAREEQVQIAMAWLRDMTVREGTTTFAEAVRPLVECLHVAAPSAQGVLAADIQAHLGWGNFLRFRETREELKIEEHYNAALAIDAANPFAHAMSGHWLAFRRSPLGEVRDRFRLALASGRERAFVQRFRIAALDWMRTPEATLELLRVADEMRRNREELAMGERHRIFNAAYFGLGREHEAELVAALPPKDNLETFRWLAAASEGNDSAHKSYYLARLTEAAGDPAGAAELYRALAREDSTFSEKARAKIARGDGSKR